MNITFGWFLDLSIIFFLIMAGVGFFLIIRSILGIFLRR
jgi:hypothetical protein